MGMAASVSCDQNILHTFLLIYHKESSLEICFNILMGLQYERHKLKGQRSTLTFGTKPLSH